MINKLGERLIGIKRKGKREREFSPYVYKNKEKKLEEKMKTRAKESDRKSMKEGNSRYFKIRCIIIV